MSQWKPSDGAQNYSRPLKVSVDDADGSSSSDDDDLQDNDNSAVSLNTNPYAAALVDGEYDPSNPTAERSSSVGSSRVLKRPFTSSIDSGLESSSSFVASTVLSPGSSAHFMPTTPTDAMNLLSRLRQDPTALSLLRSIGEKSSKKSGAGVEKTFRTKDALMTAAMGVGLLLDRLRDPGSSSSLSPNRPRITLDQLGIKLRPSRKLPDSSIVRQTEGVLVREHDEVFEMPPPPPHPTEVNQVRHLIRSKMFRCKRCKNRFIEKNILERHLRERHPKDYAAFIEEQEREIEQQRRDEIEANRIEELQSGGFIPPAGDIDAALFEVDEGDIPLPGELTGGIAPTFDAFGRLRTRRVYKKKVSPQCPFCDKRFRNEFSLKKHFVKKHPEYVDFKQCVLCYKCVKDDEELKTHACELTYVCFQCTPIRNLITEPRLFNHRKKFHRGAASGFRCNVCNLKFLTPRKLRKHKKMTHVFTKTWQCHFCEELFISETGVMTHERIHTGIIRFECKICDFHANRYTHMEEHERDEHGYLCAICRERHADANAIKSHTLEQHGGYLSNTRDLPYQESARVWIMFKGE